MFDPRSLGWEDGELKPVERMNLRPDSPAFGSGRGLFETLAIRSAKVLDLDRHLERLQRAAPALGVRPPASSTLRQAVLAVAGAASGEAPGDPQVRWLKIVAAVEGRSWIFAGALRADPAMQPARVRTVPWRRNPADPLSGLKTLNYCANELAWEWAVAQGADEGIWRNTRGHLSEGCRSNVVLIRRGALYTAREGEGILVGTVLESLLRAAADASICVHQGRVRMRSVRRADEALLTSSLAGVRPIVAWDGKRIGSGEAGALTRALAAMVERRRLEAAVSLLPP